MAALTKTTVSGLTPVTISTPVTFSASDTIVGRSDATYCIILIKGAGSTETFKIDDPNSVGPDAATTFDPDATVSVNVSTTRSFWIRDPRRFINASTGLITFTSSGANLTGYIIELL